jgi:hypothetical protein
VAPEPRRGGEGAGGRVGRAVLLGVEAGDVRPDDLGRRVAVDALGARVPGRHPALGVEHDDGVVGQALDQQPELPLALLQRPLRLVSRGDVARVLGETDQPARLVAYGVERRDGPEAAAVLAGSGKSLGRYATSWIAC